VAGLKDWFDRHHSAAVLLGGLVIGVATYIIGLESRLTDLERQALDNRASIDRIVTVMTKDIGAK
jgi:hypothetical protein